ncbi:MAG: hypothetical protein RLZZ455_376 [Candidatus Parcubacteria bacterium]|jgi:hypothetical protein
MTIFVAGLRGTNRSSAEADVRQNGNLALTQMSRMIRNAKIFNGVSVDGASNYTTTCYVPSSDPTPTPQVYKSVKVTSFDGGVSTLSCPAVGETVLTSTSATFATPFPLTDANRVIVAPSSCYFTCTQESVTDAPAIGISFTVESLRGSGAIGQSVEQLFQTVVLPRNYLR